MKNLNNIGIYKILNTENGKYYIGSSNDVKNRIRKHFELLKRNCHHSIYLQHAYNLYGKDAFSVSILENCKIDQTLIIEQTYLDAITDWTQCYNIAKMASGSGYDLASHPDCEEIRKKMSIANTGKHAKPFYINDVRYKTLKDASLILKIPIVTIAYRLKQWNTKNYYYDGLFKDTEYNENLSKYYKQPILRKPKPVKIKIKKVPFILIRPVFICGIIYNTVKEASRQLKSEYHTLLYRIGSNTIRYKDYYYMDMPKNICDLTTIDQIYEKISEKKIGNTNRKNKPFTINGIYYNSLGDASKTIKLSKDAISNRIKSDKYTEYRYA
jgi:group I intron endonuclease